jgi:putative PEP-CTERM system TPR-repeat lipoprotein
MRLPVRLAAPLLGIALTLALAGCETAEERAEGHYQRGVAFVEEGDIDRAMVEFRNVFKLNGDHTEARMFYANLLRERGKTKEAFGQYLRLVEQDPSNLEGRKQVVELALATRQFELAQTHINAAFEMAPDDPKVRAFKATVDYATGEKEAALEMALAVLADDPSQVPAHLIVIANEVNAGNFAAALPLLETALSHVPDDEALHIIKLSSLENLGENQAMGEQLKTMVALFPENESFRDALIRWHVSEGDTEAAEAILRELAERAPDAPEARFRVVQFVLQTRGPEAARAELESLIDSEASPMPYKQALATLDYSQGKIDAGLAAMRELIATSEPSDDRRDTQTALAGMLEQTGDTVGRDELVDTVLAEDASHVEALKLRARRQIDADRPELAVQDMRTALEQAPRDAEVLTLMAEAHLREGSRELAGERLALAVDASDRGMEQSIRYARFLMEDDRLGPAESVIIDALKLNRNNPELLMALAQIHLTRRDWARAAQVAGLLREQDTPAATRAADQIEATALRNQDRLDETVDMLRGLVAEDSQNTRALAGLVQTWVEAGEIEKAQAYVTEQLAADPGSVPLRMMQAGIYTVSDNLPAAEDIYREIIADQPQYAQPYRTLFALLNAQGRQDEAEAVLDQGIAAVPDSNALSFTKASLLELRENFDGAIAVYEELYARDSGLDLIANNLASLLTNHRTDSADLDRAFVIARRLRSSDVPHFQDTYGWILSQRGDPQQALDFLRSAARGLPENEIVQFHLGMTYAALERWDEAGTALERAIEIAGPDSTLPQMAQARAKLDEMASTAAPGQ